MAHDAQFFSSFHDLDDAIARISAIPGIAPRTAQTIAMRALREPDAFPAAATLAAQAEAWRPWRAYAAMQLWHSGHPGNTRTSH